MEKLSAATSETQVIQSPASNYFRTSPPCVRTTARVGLSVLLTCISVQMLQMTASELLYHIMGDRVLNDRDEKCLSQSKEEFALVSRVQNRIRKRLM